MSQKKKGKGRQVTYVVDKSYLACQHHVGLVAGLGCVQCADFSTLLGTVIYISDNDCYIRSKINTCIRNTILE